MAKVLVLYYSSYGHVEAMANAVAEGVLSAGASVELKRVPGRETIAFPYETRAYCCDRL